MKTKFTFTRIHIKLIIALLLLIVVVARFGGFSKMTDYGDMLTFAETDTILAHSERIDRLFAHPRPYKPTLDADGNVVKQRIRGVGDYDKAFPDMNDVQLATAKRLGVEEIEDREAAKQRKGNLVFIGASPFYHIQRLSHSLPYLVPRAQRLLNVIGQNFLDSLQSKGLPAYRPIVTSVLRTQADVKRLRRVNQNASANSCHQYGTTFDLAYNSYWRVIDPEDPEARQVWDGKLKDVLSEVLRDLRVQGACYVRYEKHQACFHITAR